MFGVNRARRVVPENKKGWCAVNLSPQEEKAIDRARRDERNAALTSLRILLENKPGAALNAVSEDYADMKELLARLQQPAVPSVKVERYGYIGESGLNRYRVEIGKDGVGRSSYRDATADEIAAHCAAAQPAPVCSKCGVPMDDGNGCHMAAQPSGEQAGVEDVWRVVYDAIPQLRYIERQGCPCGARPESLGTHPHVGGCGIDRLLRLEKQSIAALATSPSAAPTDERQVRVGAPFSARQEAELREWAASTKKSVPDERLREALRWLLDRVKTYLRGNPWRDADECISNAERLLDETEKESK